MQIFRNNSRRKCSSLFSFYSLPPLINSSFYFVSEVKKPLVFIPCFTLGFVAGEEVPSWWKYILLVKVQTGDAGIWVLALFCQNGTWKQHWRKEALKPKWDCLCPQQSIIQENKTWAQWRQRNPFFEHARVGLHAAIDPIFLGVTYASVVEKQFTTPWL